MDSGRSAPELRRDPIARRWVLMPAVSAPRPPARAAPPDAPGACPFCPGKEQLTPPEILAYRDSGEKNAPNWRVRVVPNSQPALKVEARLEPRGVGPYDAMGGVGAHEILIESPDHDRDLADLSPAELGQVLSAWRDRIADLGRDSRLKHALIFRNRGAAAGATLWHPHSQIVALPFVPPLIAEELSGAERYYRERERCAFCDIVRHEVEARARLVLEDEGAVALAPYASRRPFELWVLPRRHAAAFEDDPPEAAAEVLSKALRALSRALDRPAYHLALHSAPYALRGCLYYHWHVEVAPAPAAAPGLELAGGCALNPTAPEAAAAFLREVAL